MTKNQDIWEQILLGMRSTPPRLVAAGNDEESSHSGVEKHASTGVGGTCDKSSHLEADLCGTEKHASTSVGGACDDDIGIALSQIRLFLRFVK